MTLYAIIETDAGLTVAEMGRGTYPEEEAARHGGVLVDPGPYPTYEDAYDAMLALADEDDDEDSQ